jgi:hypothetical protein
MRLEDKRLLSRIVAALEVLFTPFRYPETDDRARTLAAVQERRRRYQVGGGVELTVGGGTVNRQRGFQSLRRLESAGLVQLHRMGVHRGGVSLRRLDAALSLTPNSTIGEAWPILSRLVELHEDPDVLRNGQDFLLECDVVGIGRGETDGEQVAEFECDAFPLLLSGLAETITDAAGSIGWRITEAGRQAMIDGPPAPDDLSKEYSAAIADEYDRLVLCGLKERDAWLPERIGEINIPLSAGTWTTWRIEVEDGRRPDLTLPEGGASRFGPIARFRDRQDPDEGEGDG